MRRIPIVATIVVALAIGTMIMLGLWQLERARWKEALLASYHASSHAAPIDGLPTGEAPEKLAFRRTHVACKLTTGATMLGGPDAKGRTGFRNIAGCALADGRLIAIDLGWTAIDAHPPLPAIGQMVQGHGLIIPDDVLVRRVLGGNPKAEPLLIVLDEPVPGLAPSQPPAIETIPNNHRSYAVQWFLFAGVALIIYVLALRRRNRVG